LKQFYFHIIKDKIAITQVDMFTNKTICQMFRYNYKGDFKISPIAELFYDLSKTIRSTVFDI